LSNSHYLVKPQGWVLDLYSSITKTNQTGGFPSEQPAAGLLCTNIHMLRLGIFKQPSHSNSLNSINKNSAS